MKEHQKVLLGFEPWRPDLPTITGWYVTRRTDRVGTPRFEERRFFDGQWSEPVLVGYDDDVEATYAAATHATNQFGIEWYGLDEPSVHGYTYALVLLGPFMSIPLHDACDRLMRRLS